MAFGLPAERARAHRQRERLCPSRALAQPAAPVLQQSVPSPAESQAPLVKGTTALKEWAVAIEALHRGEQTILLRKGGIREPTFRPPGTEFFLFPTSFHSQTELLKPGVAERYAQALALEPKNEAVLSLGTYVQVTGAWTTEDAGVLEVLDGLHLWTREFVEARLKWRAQQPLTLLELRAWRLPQPLQLMVKEEMFGCFSCVELAQGLEGQPMVAGQPLVPAIDDEEFKKRQAHLRSQLMHVEHKPLQL